ncbi:unnamed protein product [marine sediment metagenome]|uniref:Uncharacterized protein n=1 Tax=marine sediment metagenome TaxID=412755 RepID=X0WZM7_9ZZZZ
MLKHLKRWYRNFRLKKEIERFIKWQKWVKKEEKRNLYSVSRRAIY